MPTMPETVAQRMERMDPSPAVIDWSKCGERSWTKSRFSWRLSLVSAKISAWKVRGGDVCPEGEGEGGAFKGWGADMGNGSCQSLVARGDGGDLHQGTEWGAECREVSRKQGGVCV